MAWQERVNKILRRFPSWWRRDTDSNTFGLIKSFSNEFDGFSTESNNMKLEMYVDTATGIYLDDLAKIFKLIRKPGETDTQLRARIKAYWPGFSGGGTKDAIISTINKMTGIPETDISVTDIPSLKILVEIIYDPLYATLMTVIEETIWKIKAAGVYPFLLYTLIGGDLDEALQVSDSVNISIVSPDAFFRWEVSDIEGGGILS